MNSNATSHARLSLFAALIGFAALWALLVHHLSIHWSLNPQYSYGWFVPVLALYLFGRRWTARPAPEQPHGNLSTAAFLFALMAFAATWIVAQPNPDWRLVSWAFALEAVVMTLAALHRAGGIAWVRHFAFPVCFLLVAIPWPTALENAVIQNLMSFVASVTVEGLNVLNIAAVQRGNLIEVSKGILGVDDACSGVRSLQATLMAALFLGELFRFRLIPRIVLLVCGIAFALLCNIARAFLLAWTAAKHGPEAIARWHDPAGFTILLVCFAGLCVLAALIRKANGPEAPLPACHEPAHALPAGLGFGLIAMIVITLAGSEIWYRQNSAGEGEFLTYTWPAGASQIPIADEARQLLQYDRGSAASWRMPDGTVWRAFAFEWKPGARRSTILARMHRPDVCLPASGMELREDRATTTFPVDGHEVPFRAYTFGSDKGPLHVFFCVWRGTPTAEAQILRSETESFPRLRAVARGERNTGQQVLEFVLSGYESAAAAEKALREQLPGLIRSSQTVP